MKYIYPKTSPKAGQTTTIRAEVWSCPLCHYTSSLADDIAEHRQLARQINTINGAGRKVTQYKVVFNVKDKGRIAWSRYGETMEDCLSAAKKASFREYGHDNVCNFTIYSPQSPCGHYACNL